jgi:hypothetical protein
MTTNNFHHADNLLMKSSICFFFFLMLLGSCDSNRSAYEYRPISPAMDRKPISKIEKAWVARHQYDHERRLLIPKLGGARWGAVQEYKENGTIEFKDWWERDVKIEDLEAAPSTVLSISRVKERKSIPPHLGFDRLVVPDEGSVPEPFSVPGLPALEGIPPVPADDTPFPALPDPDDLPPLDSTLPSFPPAFAPPAEPGVSPFAPLPGSLPGELPELGPPGGLPAEGNAPDVIAPEMEEGKPEEGNPFPDLPPDPFEKLP